MGWSMTVKLTPRQRCAVRHPVASSTVPPHARHIKRNGNIQTTLTFDLAPLESLIEDDVPLPDEIVERAINGWFGVWHGSVTTFPITHTHAWCTLTTAKAEGVLKRLCASVGIKETAEVHLSSDEKSIHVYRWATLDELAIALEMLE